MNLRLHLHLHLRVRGERERERGEFRVSVALSGIVSMSMSICPWTYRPRWRPRRREGREATCALHDPTILTILHGLSADVDVRTWGALPPPTVMLVKRFLRLAYGGAR
eukprot:scaffold100277_cov30-Tisochrysis_lutea.AAC.4